MTFRIEGDGGQYGRILRPGARDLHGVRSQN
jgi:hypothetical protein